MGTFSRLNSRGMQTSSEIDLLLNLYRLIVIRRQNRDVFSGEFLTHKLPSADKLLTDFSTCGQQIQECTFYCQTTGGITMAVLMTTSTMTPELNYDEL